MPRPRLGAAQIEALTSIAKPTMILLTPKKRDERLVALGLAKHPAPGCKSLCITPAGLRFLADEIEAGRIEDAEIWSAKRRAEQHQTPDQ